MTKTEKEARLIRWRAIMKRRNLKVIHCAKLWKIRPQVAYNWHSGQGAVPLARLEELEAAGR
jgi:hypothetical protein